MIKLKLTHAMNVVILLIGVIMSLGIGPSHPIMFVLYGAACIFIFLFRSKFYYLSIIASLLTIVLFIINYTFSHGVQGSFVPGTSYVTTSVVLSLGCVITYFILNLVSLKKGTVDRVKNNASK